MLCLCGDLDIYGLRNKIRTYDHTHFQDHWCFNTKPCRAKWFELETRSEHGKVCLNNDFTSPSCNMLCMSWKHKTDERENTVINSSLCDSSAFSPPHRNLKNQTWNWRVELFCSFKRSNTEHEHKSQTNATWEEFYMLNCPLMRAFTNLYKLPLKLKKNYWG